MTTKIGPKDKVQLAQGRRRRRYAYAHDACMQWSKQYIWLLNGRPHLLSAEVDQC